MKRSPRKRLGRRPTVSRRVVTVLARLYGNAAEALLTLSISKICSLTAASKPTVKRLRARAKASLPLVPQIPEIDRKTQLRRKRASFVKRRRSDAEIRAIKAHYARRAKQNGIIDRAFPFRRASTSPTSGPFASWYVEDDTLPFGPEDRAALAKIRQKQRAAASTTARKSPCATRSGLSDLPSPLTSPPPSEFASHESAPDQASRPSPARSAAIGVTRSNTAPSTCVPHLHSSSPTTASASRESTRQSLPLPPRVAGATIGTETVSSAAITVNCATDSPSLQRDKPHISNPFRPNPRGDRWTQFGKAIINGALRDNRELRAWFAHLPQNMTRELKREVIEGIDNHVSTVAWAIQPPDKTKSVTHIHILSLADGSAHAHRQFGRGTLERIYANSSPYSYLRYMLKRSIDGIHWAAAAPPELRPLDDATHAFVARHVSTSPPARSFLDAGYEVLNDLLERHAPLHHYQVALDSNIDTARLKAILSTVRHSPGVVVSALHPPTDCNPSYVLNLLAVESPSSNSLLSALNARLVPCKSTPFNLLLFWHREELAAFPDFAIHFGTKTHWSLRECNHPHSIPRPIQPSAHAASTHSAPIRSKYLRKVRPDLYDPAIDAFPAPGAHARAPGHSVESIHQPTSTGVAP